MRVSSIVALFVATVMAIGPAVAATKKTKSPDDTSSASANAQNGPEIPEIACKTNFKEVSLSAKSIRKGDTAYVEFRSRLSPAIISGHMYVVFGRLGDDGTPLTHQLIGLYPKGSVLGLYGGAIAWVPANVKPSAIDCSGISVIDAWRVSLNEAQYQKLLAKARDKLAKPPLWNMFGYNCNHFAAEFGEVAGLRKPSNSELPAFAYLPAFIKSNPTRAK